jgi:hypothetical protein
MSRLYKKFSKVVTVTNTKDEHAEQEVALQSGEFILFDGFPAQCRFPTFETIRMSGADVGDITGYNVWLQFTLNGVVVSELYLFSGNLNEKVAPVVTSALDAGIIEYPRPDWFYGMDAYEKRIIFRTNAPIVFPVVGHVAMEFICHLEVLSA